MRLQKIFLIVFASFISVYTLDSCGPKGPYNPFLKKRTKPSEELRQDLGKLKQKTGRVSKRQIRKNKRSKIKSDNNATRERPIRKFFRTHINRHKYLH